MWQSFFAALAIVFVAELPDITPVSVPDGSTSTTRTPRMALASPASPSVNDCTNAFDAA